MSNPIFIIDLGPMFSGKTDELIRRCIKMSDSLYHVIDEEENKVLLVVDANQKDRNVTTESEGMTTHSSRPLNFSTLKVKAVERLQEIPDSELENITLIGIDEAFFPDLYETVLHWYLDLKISISIAAVDGSHSQQILTPQLFQLIPYATKIVKHSAYCFYCLKRKQYISAYYTIKKENKDIEMEYGGNELYVPVCFTHLKN